MNPRCAVGRFLSLTPGSVYNIELTNEINLHGVEVSVNFQPPPPPASYVMPMLRTIGNSVLMLISWTLNGDVLAFSNHCKLFQAKHSKLIVVCPLFLVEFL